MVTLLADLQRNGQRPCRKQGSPMPRGQLKERHDKQVITESDWER